MKKIVVFSNSDRHIRMLDKVRREISDEQGLLGADSRSFFFSPMMEWNDRYEQELLGADYVIFAWQGTVGVSCFIAKALEFCSKREIAYANFSFTDPSEEEFDGFFSWEVERLKKYLLFSGKINFYWFWQWLWSKNSKNESKISEPIQVPWMGIYDPDYPASYQNLDDYSQNHFQNKIKIGLLFSRENWLWGDTHYLDDLIEELRRRNFDVIPVYCLWESKLNGAIPGIVQAIDSFFYHEGKPIISGVINTFKVGMTRSSQNTPDFLRNLNVPIIQGQNILRSFSEWDQTLEGMTPVELAVNIVEPEFDGILHGGVASTKESATDGFQYAGVPDRITALAKKIGKWSQLRHKANRNKKVAIILHNYPASNANIGTAQGLDSLESAIRILQGMEQRDYRVGTLPKNGQELVQKILQSVTNDRRFLKEEQLDQAVGKVSTKDYQKWFTSLDVRSQEELLHDWGEPPGTVFLQDDYLAIPGIRTENVIISVQPPRGFGEDPDKILHSPVCYPPHHYFAYYFWLREIWQVDAIIHLGTHGSLEWLPGKNAGLSQKCCPEMALGDLPNIYPYYTTIVGEGLQAKRRSSACLIGHLCPPMDQAELYEELEELEKLLDEYAHFTTDSSQPRDLILEEILTKVNLLHLSEDLPWDPGEEVEAYILRVHCYLENLKQMQIRVGLHILGEAPSGMGLSQFVLALTRSDNSGIPSLPKIISDQLGVDYYELLEKSGEISEGGKTYGEVLTEVWQFAEFLVESLGKEKFASVAIEKVMMERRVISLFNDLESQERLTNLLRYICERLVPNLRKTEQEITNILRSLDGEYIEPSIGGAPTSGQAEILPTGRNFYGVDPNQLPTLAAWKMGSMLAEQTIARFICEESRYPESIGMIFWASENIRTQGKCLSEFFKLLGVKPVWQKGSRRLIDLEIIPLEELQRPRIDVIARISGLYRDALPITVEWMEKAIALVADLDESLEMNYIKKHVVEDKEELVGQGVDSEVAEKQAKYRIFGCPPGGYGAGVANLLEERNWQTEEELGAVYIRWGAHAYGKEERGSFLPQLFKKRLGQLDVTIKNIDNHEVHLLNSDDFNSYCGGMNVAVKSLRGKLPKCYIGDSADRGQVVVKSLSEEFRRVFRGESLNPKYIEGMMKHGYKGASDLASLASRSYAWDVTSELMEDWMYENLTHKLALDASVQEWMREVNPWALQRMSEKLLEAIQRGFWNASSEMAGELKELYLSLEGDFEERADSRE